MFGTNSTTLPISGEKQTRKISQKLEWWLYIGPVWEAVKSQKWWAGSPTVVTYIHRLNSPPPPGSGGLLPVCVRLPEPAHCMSDRLSRLTARQARHSCRSRPLPVSSSEQLAWSCSAPSAPIGKASGEREVLFHSPWTQSGRVRIDSLPLGAAAGVWPRAARVTGGKCGTAQSNSLHGTSPGRLVWMFLRRII